MNADLTFNTIVFKKSFDEKDGSERVSTTRDINLPDILSIKRQSYVDSATKVPGTRYTISVDRHDKDAQDVKYISRAYLVIAVPSTENSTDLGVLITTFKAAVADASLIAAVLNSET
jgi:hypothetical protein